MRTNIEIDDKLMKEAMKATKLKTKRATVEAGLKELILKSANEDMRSLRGKGWGWPEDK
jgi:Arc/MetJ family transcription regulator